MERCRLQTKRRLGRVAEAAAPRSAEPRATFAGREARPSPAGGPQPAGTAAAGSVETAEATVSGSPQGRMRAVRPQRATRRETSFPHSELQSSSLACACSPRWRSSCPSAPARRRSPGSPPRARAGAGCRRSSLATTSTCPRMTRRGYPRRSTAGSSSPARASWSSTRWARRRSRGRRGRRLPRSPTSRPDTWCPRPSMAGSPAATPSTATRSTSPTRATAPTSSGC